MGEHEDEGLKIADTVTEEFLHRTPLSNKVSADPGS
jgi:hypothetical protein